MKIVNMTDLEASLFEHSKYVEFLCVGQFVCERDQKVNVNMNFPRLWFGLPVEF